MHLIATHTSEKNAYMAISRIYLGHTELQGKILQILDNMLEYPEERVRQTSVYSLGQIGKKCEFCNENV